MVGIVRCHLGFPGCKCFVAQVLFGPQSLWIHLKKDPPKVQDFLKLSPRKTNMAPEDQWLEDVVPIEIVPLSRRHVSFWGV